MVYAFLIIDMAGFIIAGNLSGVVASQSACVDNFRKSQSIDLGQPA
jgi:hypothetical protein